jgi:hypothetical protein
LETKWSIVSGIVVSVASGLIIFILTNPGGPLNPPKEDEPPKVVVLEFNVDPAFVGRNVTAHFKVYNDSNVAGVDCIVRWAPAQNIVEVWSPHFSIIPKETATFTLTKAGGLQQPGLQESTAHVDCSKNGLLVYRGPPVIRDIDVKS